jgi:ppGpp synthetase/RelA/SpoT-type nucleotidyltranferase
MTEAELRDRYEREGQMYEAYGLYVMTVLSEKIRAQVSSGDFGELFKIPPTYRTKETKSLVEKAFYRGKDYANPYDAITDKVGVRFVVLLQSQLHKIRDLVKAMSEFDVEKARDYEDDRRENPVSFEYQSIHFIVSPSSELVLQDEVVVPENTPCEVQLRTILQHAHSELTHNTVYKPRLVATPEVRRGVAKSMALIETTGDVFDSVEKKLNDMNEQFRHINEQLARIYERFATPEYHKRLSNYLLGALNSLLEDIPFQLGDVAKFYESDESDSIVQYVMKRREDSLLYRQPAILLVFYLVKKYKYRVHEYWPLTHDELRPIYSHFGFSLDSITGAGVH